MAWNWQCNNWPDFSYDSEQLKDYEARFLHSSGVLSGALRHINDASRQQATIGLMCTEALKTSEIEGEILDRNSVQSSIRKNFGLQSDGIEIPPAEAGIAEMMVDLYQNYKTPLDHNTLFEWHDMLMNGRRDLDIIGNYRTHKDAMQIISGSPGNLTVHFEAPPSKVVPEAMERFVAWFNDSSPEGPCPLAPLTRAGIAHLYFVSIHPFEDGNGRIGRAISEKALSQCLGGPTLIALSMTIEKGRRYYYEALERNNKNLEIMDWLIYFSEMLLDAQAYSQSYIDFLIDKTRMYDRLKGQLNERQEIMLVHLFNFGPDSVKIELSAEQYIKYTKTSRATATRDLQDLVEKNVLIKTGERKATRYFLNISNRNIN